MRAVGAAVGVLLMAGVVGLAIELDERNGGDESISLGGDTGVFEVEAMPIPPDREAIVTAPSIEAPSFDVRPEFPEVPPALTAPALPESRTVEPMPPYDMPSPPPMPTPRTYPSGSDCGTPSGRNGWGADKTASQGSFRMTLRIFTCHQYDGDMLENSLAIDKPNAVIKDIVVDYGDGATFEGPSFDSCEENGSEPTRRLHGPFHAYDAPKTYTIKATVKWASCSNGVEGPVQTTTVSMPVFRHAGEGP